MKIIRWLLSHSLFILLIVAVIYAYMFWGNLLGEDTPAGKAVAYLSEEFVEVKEFVDAVKAKQEQLSEEKTAQQASGSKDKAQPAASEDKDVQIQTAAVTTENAGGNNADGNNEVEATNAEETNSPSAQQVAGSVESLKAASGEASEKQAAVLADDTKNEPGKVNEGASVGSPQSSAVDNIQAASDNDNSASVDMAAADQSTEDRYVPAEIEQQLNRVDSHGEVFDVSQPTGELRDQWIAARTAFYQRNYELSEKTYQQVIDSTTDNFDAYGELGNVYFNQGKHKEAASAYFEAAAILVGKGQVYRARSLIGLLRHLDSSKADELQKLIDSAKSEA